MSMDTFFVLRSKNGNNSNPVEGLRLEILGFWSLWVMVNNAGQYAQDAMQDEHLFVQKPSAFL